MEPLPPIRPTPILLVSLVVSITFGLLVGLAVVAITGSLGHALSAAAGTATAIFLKTLIIRWLYASHFRKLVINRRRTT
ncbi:hypothetical protein [Streptomyces cinereoruber]|uniref:hypothetical protein n=1 Tax=Streptomyces cinereoruber TaxID=67260 RepID=UPI003644A4EF